MNMTDDELRRIIEEAADRMEWKIDTFRRNVVPKMERRARMNLIGLMWAECTHKGRDWNDYFAMDWNRVNLELLRRAGWIGDDDRS